MQIPNADENNIVQDLYCVCLRIKEFIHLTKNACRTSFKMNCDRHFTYELPYSSFQRTLVYF